MEVGAMQVFVVVGHDTVNRPNCMQKAFEIIVWPLNNTDLPTEWQWQQTTSSLTTNTQCTILVVNMQPALEDDKIAYITSIVMYIMFKWI